MVGGRRGGGWNRRGHWQTITAERGEPRNICAKQQGNNTVGVSDRCLFSPSESQRNYPSTWTLSPAQRSKELPRIPSIGGSSSSPSSFQSNTSCCVPPFFNAKRAIIKTGNVVSRNDPEGSLKRLQRQTIKMH